MAEINILTEVEAEESAKSCKWAVCFNIDHTKPGCQSDNGKLESVQTVAIFQDPYQAQDFIDLCLPKDRHDRFYIMHIYNDYAPEIKAKQDEYRKNL